MGGPPAAEDLLPFAGRLADLAGEVIRRFYRKPFAVESKPDASPVTIADREAELAMRQLIRIRYPEHGIEGEEFGTERGNAELVWHLDPIDGTKSFIIGRPLFGTLIGLSHRGQPLLGLIDQGISGERWIGVMGRGTSWNGEAIRVRSCPNLGDAVLGTTSPLMFAAGAERAAFTRVQEAVRYPLFGGDCYTYGLLAMGLVDLVIETDLDTHDFMALVPVVEGAGGVMTDWYGQPLHAGSDGRIIAAGDGRTHAAARALLERG